ncbi:hypothetical protein Dimus_039214 [Dionaea muscipula]
MVGDSVEVNGDDDVEDCLASAMAFGRPDVATGGCSTRRTAAAARKEPREGNRGGTLPLPLLVAVVGANGPSPGHRLPGGLSPANSDESGGPLNRCCVYGCSDMM